MRHVIDTLHDLGNVHGRMNFDRPCQGHTRVSWVWSDSSGLVPVESLHTPMPHSNAALGAQISEQSAQAGRGISIYPVNRGKSRRICMYM